MGVLRMLEAIRIHTQNDMSRVRFYQASSSEMFGKVREVPQRETTPFHPRSPYGVAKIFGHYMTVNYRESYGAYACSGILFNHESPRRGHEFVTRKVTRAVARIALGLQKVARARQPRRASGLGLRRRLRRGDVADAAAGRARRLRRRHRRDATHPRPARLAFARVGIDDWEPYVMQDPRFFRPAEVDLLVGDADQGPRRLGWKPKVGFQAAGRDDGRRRPGERETQCEDRPGADHR